MSREGKSDYATFHLSFPPEVQEAQSKKEKRKEKSNPVEESCDDSKKEERNTDGKGGEYKIQR